MDFMRYSLRDVKNKMDRLGFYGQEKSSLALHVDRIVKKSGTEEAIKELKLIAALLPDGMWTTMPKSEIRYQRSM